jgi:hypothetical protein
MEVLRASHIVATGSREPVADRELDGGHPGRAGGGLLLASVGVLAIGVAVVAFAIVLRSEGGARAVGSRADRLVDPLARRLRHGRSVDLTGKILDFRSSVVDVMRTRWVQVTVSTLLLQLTSCAIPASRPALPGAGHRLAGRERA